MNEHEAHQRSSIDDDKSDEYRRRVIDYKHTTDFEEMTPAFIRKMMTAMRAVVYGRRDALTPLHILPNGWTVGDFCMRYVFQMERRRELRRYNMRKEKKKEIPIAVPPSTVSSSDAGAYGNTPAFIELPTSLRR